MLRLECSLPVWPNPLNEDLLNESELTLDEPRGVDLGLSGRGESGEGGRVGKERKGSKGRKEEVDELRGRGEGFAQACREGGTACGEVFGLCRGG